MNRLENLYKKWLVENNKGHYNKIKEFSNDVLKLFGNQDQIVEYLTEISKYYGIKLRGKVLDIGCSMGGLLFSLYKSKKFDFIAGIDIDKTAIEMAKEYKKMSKILDDQLFVEIAQIENLPFQDNFFDFIIVKDVFEHLSNELNLKKAIINIKRVLKEGGFIFIETPNYFFPFEPHLKIISLPYFQNKFIIKILAKIYRRDEKFVDHLYLTKPNMLEKIFKYSGLGYYNVYEDYKLPIIIKNPQKLSLRFKFLSPFFYLINLFHFNKIVLNILKKIKMYPTLQYLVFK